mmetsp:Transcript_12582/g.35349  ORF Transcript_12582/g.35349 Transcript_12582/m.35349 type:complete len:420 (+) Transcript_12582:229-1488(+)
MSLKGADCRVVNQLIAAFKVERDLSQKADDNALSGSSPVFSPQLWRASGLSPKLMGERRAAFLRQEQEAQMLKQGLVLVPNKTRGARAMNRASRQRYTAVQEDSQFHRSPKSWKTNAIVQYEKSSEKSGRHSRQSSHSGDADPQSLGKRSVSSTSLSVKTAADPPPLPKKQSLGTPRSPKGSQPSPKAAASKDCSLGSLQVKISAPDSSSFGSSCCTHCKVLVGPKGCGKPLVNCRDCGQVMHFDCYVEWNGAEPGPWDVILCPAHKPPKRIRHRGPADENLRPTHKQRSASQSPRASECKPPPPLKRVMSSSPRALNAVDAKLSSDQHLTHGFSSSKEVLSPRRSPSSPGEDSNVSSYATHLSPSVSEDGMGHTVSAAIKAEAMAVERFRSQGSKPNDEELAMQLHRELNSVPTRRRR